MQLKGVHHIALNVRDIARAEEFYTRVMGFNVANRYDGNVPHIEVDAGNARLALFEAPDLDQKTSIETLSETGYLHYAFQTSKEEFDSAIEELKSHGVDVSEPRQLGQGMSVYFNDPDGNHLEIRYDYLPND